jgi:hypothetical protein
MANKAWYTSLAAVGLAVALAATWLPQIDAAKRAPAVTVGSNDIGGTVTSSKGPEAGVWVVAETTDLPTKFVKIVVTDEAGRYLVPDLPKANYKVWVRGYGLVDSAAVQSVPGKDVDLTAKVAPDAKSAAQYYPADYWYSLLKLQPRAISLAPAPAAMALRQELRVRISGSTRQRSIIARRVTRLAIRPRAN